MNKQAIIGLAVATAVYRRDWIQDTSFSEMFYDFPGIIQQAQDYLTCVGITDYTVTGQDICDTLGFDDYETCVSELEEEEAE